MSIWDDYARDAEKGTGGDWPEVPDDLYEAMVRDVSEPETGPDRFNPGKERTQFFVNFELTNGDVPDGTTLRYYVTIPEGYLRDGYLSEKSRLFKLMDALGFDMSGRFRVDPREWQGERVRVMVENKANEQGEMRPRITDVKAPRKKAAPKREPVAAGSRRNNSAPFGEEDEED